MWRVLTVTSKIEDLNVIGGNKGMSVFRPLAYKSRQILVNVIG